MSPSWRRRLTCVSAAGFYTFPCAASLDVSLSFAGQKFSVNSDDLNIGTVSETSEYVHSFLVLPRSLFPVRSRLMDRTLCFTATVWAGL